MKNNLIHFKLKAPIFYLILILLFLPLFSYADSCSMQFLKENAKSCYKLTESGFNYIDDNGIMDLTSGQATQQVNGIQDKAQYFSGNDYLGGSAIYGGRDLSMFAVIKRNLSATTHEMILNRYGGAGNRLYMFRVEAGSDNLAIWIGDGTLATDYLNSGTPQDKWINAYWSYRNSDKAVIVGYNSSYTQTTATYGMGNTSQIFELGDAGVVNDLIIDEVRIFTAYLNTTCIDEVNYLIEKGYTCDLLPKYNVTIFSPPEIVYTQYDLNVSFEVFDSTAYNSSCSLYINNVSNTTIQAYNSTSTNILVDLTEINKYDFYLNCTSDSGENYITETRKYYFDDTEPLIVIYSPFNNSNYNNTNEIVYINATIYNQNILWANLYVFKPNKNILYSELSGNITGAKNYNFTKYINLSGEAYGTYEVFVEASDLYIGVNYNNASVFFDFEEPQQDNITVGVGAVSIDLEFEKSFSIIASFLIWIIILYFTIKTNDGIMRIFTGILGVFIAIWLITSVTEFPSLVSVAFGFLNAYLMLLKPTEG